MVNWINQATDTAGDLASGAGDVGGDLASGATSTVGNLADGAASLLGGATREAPDAVDTGVGATQDVARGVTGFVGDVLAAPTRQLQTGLTKVVVGAVALLIGALLALKIYGESS